jgi:hypothetical protein
MEMLYQEQLMFDSPTERASSSREIGTVETSGNDQAEIRECIIEALARVRCVTPREIHDEIAAKGGDCEITAKEAMVVGIAVENNLGYGKLFTPWDFSTEAISGGISGNSWGISPNGCMDPAEDTTVSRFLGVVLRKISSLR